MKGKKATYILLVLVTALWGTIGYRIYNHIRKPDIDSNTPQFIADKSDDYFKSDTIVPLKLNYSDPFLKYNFVPSTPDRENKIKKSAVNIRQRINEANPDIKVIHWPDISYNGIILNDKTDEKLGLIIIAKESFLMRKGEQRNGITLLELYSDSVKVNFQKKDKIILKKN